MPFASDPLYLSAALLLVVALSEWIGRRAFFRHVGPAFIVIILGAILSNARLIPASAATAPLYDGVFNFIAPLAIFFLLLDVRLADVRRAGLPMLLLFGLGSAATMGGSVAGYYLVAGGGAAVPQGPAIAGMFTGTYIGGAVNLNAIALQYGVNKEGTLFAAINAADNIITAVWMIATLVLPRVLQQWFPRTGGAGAIATAGDPTPISTDAATGEAGAFDFALLIALGCATLFVSHAIAHVVPAIPFVLILTTVALALAQLPLVQRLRGGQLLGNLTVLLFLAVVGAHCDFGALVSNGSVALRLLAWVTLTVGIHALLLFGLGGVLRQDWAVVSIASNANIGGAATAGVLATSIGRGDLRLPGILVGAVGNAVGTYAGVLVVECLR